MKSNVLSTVAADPFTSKLFDIYDKVWQLGSAQPISLGIFRSDYFIETSSGLHDEYRSSSIQPASNDDTDLIHIKQVELNTMSLGGTTFACLVPELHRYLLRLVGRQESKVPPNNALDELADGLIKAWELYGEASAVIMFIVDPDEWNVYCQRILEYRIKERNSAVGVIRRSLTDIFNNSEADKKNNGSLFMQVVRFYFLKPRPQLCPSF
ncbi:glutathione synthetase-like isoform X3 [Orbicella faveolata]|uniref:glutathione synthetase-like isoform X3 n=1 Tax=Orbicella faveolata TaxID=48498 RepID=UPI0009E411F0|nr:glutathione synthetase-like isoform X3 [Orbicella faveolata]